MTADEKSRAEARLEAALEGAGHRDPRPFFRAVLKHLRERDDEAFRGALRYYEDELVPAVAGDEDPLGAWAEYGLVLARALGPGRRVELDSTGRARAVETQTEPTGLVLHIPDATDAPVLVLRYPRQASPAQHAAFELLVRGKQTASAYD